LSCLQALDDTDLLWRGYQTDGLVWVVDSADRRRLEDCKRELKALLTQEVLSFWPCQSRHMAIAAF
jgi:hypothetical protein